MCARLDDCTSELHTQRPLSLSGPKQHTLVQLTLTGEFRSQKQIDDKIN